MLYLIGLGLNEKGISKEGLLALESCSKVYLETYTVNFPYAFEDLHLGKKKIEALERKDVESNLLIKEAKSRNIGLLVYGSPLFATTHLTLINDANEQGIRTKVVYAASVFDAIAETGLQLYKFGKTASMPAWKKNFEPDSFIEIIKQNKGIKAHTLILVDIGLGFKRAVEQLRESCKRKEFNLGKVVVCSQLGTTNQKIFYNSLDKINSIDINFPFCIIIPSELHFTEEETLKRL